MSIKSQIQELKMIAKDMGIRVVESKGSFTTNYCKIDEGMVIVINKTRGIRARLAGLAKIFSSLTLDGTQIKPETMKLIDSYREST